MKQSILHQAPITPGQAAREGIALAQQAEEPSYPLWYTERQNMPSIASSATSVPITHVAARTSTIKLGSAGLCAEPLATGDRRAVRHARPLPMPGRLGGTSIRDYLAFTGGHIAVDDRHADGGQIGLPGTTSHEADISSAFGSTLVIITDGHLPIKGGTIPP
jgi:hypothetical protein